MWPIIYALGTRFSRYLVLPAAALVGTVGYYLEKKFVPKQKPIEYLGESIQDQRERRLASSPSTPPSSSHSPLPNSLGVLQPRSDH